MTEPFLISDDKLRGLSATRQGRVSIAGYNYQAGYAVARLASMCVREPVLDLEDWPQRLRYDWGEDLDEVCDGNIIRFTQCKRVATIGQPASLAEVLIGFAPKWLWVTDSERDRLRFRLVCSDPRFAATGMSLDSLKAEVHGHFLTRLVAPAGPQSDLAVWIAEASAVGGGVLFDALWSRFDCVYLPAEVVDSEPAGPRLAAEREALRVLLERNRIDPSGQTQVLGGLRRLIHDNLILFEPTNESIRPSFDRSPRRLDRADVNAAIDRWRPATHRPPPFQLVDRTFLSEQRELERQQFVARQPDWCDIAHGRDETIKFIERDQTEELASAVLEKVVARLGRGGKLPTLFVAGAPGEGKTTIVRRVAAHLVDAGELLIADTGVGLHEPPGEADEYVQAIERLQGFGRPVVLLLDDPLYAESLWLDVLKKLNRPGLRVGVLAASPQFLFDEHKSQLWACDVSTFKLARPSQNEAESLAALYGHSVSLETEEDFLVVAMQTAAGVPFREIIDRLWLTLADGRDLSSSRSLFDLPWQTRAYLFVCFFSRAYEACPEPLLLKLLEMTGGVPGTSDVRTELQRMKHKTGWRIFRIGQRAEAVQRYQGVPITAAHTVIARQAWEQRPLDWCTVGDVVIQASVAVPQTIRDVSSLGVRLEAQSFAGSTAGADGYDFGKMLIERWRHESSVETRHVCDLLTPRIMHGCAELVIPIREILIRRATPDSQGWLAALQLWHLRNHLEKHGDFPAEMDLLSLIQSADFSVASNRAQQFARRLERDTPLRDAFAARLLDAFDGKLGWQLDNHLLTFLLAIATPDQLSPRVSQIRVWLENHPDVTDTRAKYLSFLPQLPMEFSNLRLDAARQTEKWLETHGEDTRVRAQYLLFLLQLPMEFSTLRGDAARQTAKWLETHGEDTHVRRPYLSFLLKLPAEFSNLRADAAHQTAKWLEANDEDTDIRRQFLFFLLEIPYGLTGTGGTMRVDEWQQLASTALNDAANLTIRSGWQSQHRPLVTSYYGIHLELFRSLNLHDSEVVRKVLRLSHDVTERWFDEYPFSSVQYDLPLPDESLL